MDRCIDRAARLGALQSVLVAAAVYLGRGIGLPTLLHADRFVLITFTTEGAAFAALILCARALPFVEARLRRQQLQLTTNLRRLSAREFEDMVAAMFEGEGWDVEKTGGHGTPDGNIDLRLRDGGRKRLVQCKRWTSWDLGVDEVRKLAGTLLREGLSGADGILVTSSGFYPAAVAEAEQLGLKLIDGNELVDRLHTAGALQLQSAARDDWLCPSCAEPMLLGKSSYGWWLRCPRHGCHGKHDLGADDRAAVERLMAGTET